jgi:hypothetical protein
MILDLVTLLDSKIKDQLKISHLETKIKNDVQLVIPCDEMNSKLKGVIKEEHGSDLLKDVDYIVLFMETSTPTNSNPQKDEESDEDISDDSKDNESDVDDSNDDALKETPEDSKSNTDDEEDDEEEIIKENMKIQDLTSSMVSSVKATQPKVSQPKTSNKTTQSKQESSPKKTQKKDRPQESKKIDEAETKVTGEKLRASVHNAINKLFESQINDENILELYDIKKYKENCYFITISLKEHKKSKSRD